MEFLWFNYVQWLNCVDLKDPFTWQLALRIAKEICIYEDALIANRLWVERAMYSPIMPYIIDCIRIDPVESFYSWVKTIDLADDLNWMNVVWEANKLGIMVETIPNSFEYFLKNGYTRLIKKEDAIYIVIEKSFRAFSGGSVKKFLKNEVYSVFTNLENGLMYPEKLLL